MNTNATTSSSSPATSRRPDRPEELLPFQSASACLLFTALCLFSGCQHTETISYPDTGLEFTVKNPD